MDKKAVFLDIDGTILDEEKNIPESTREAVKQLQDQEIPVIIATGRATQHFEDIREELNIQSYICFNGSYVVLDGELVYDRPLQKERLINLERIALKREHPMVFLNEVDVFANNPDHEHIHESLGSINLSHPPYHETFHRDNNIYQALLFVDRKEGSWYEKTQNEFDFVRWHEKCLDVLPLGGSKAVGIKQILQRMKIEVKNAIAFGDGLNDIEMLRFVGCGVAMGNGEEEAKKAADIVTDHVSNDGIYKGLQKIGIIK